MPKWFNNNSTNASRALQVWQILIGKAFNRQTITYGLLAKLLGYKGSGVLAVTLGHIHHYCNQNDLPFLNVLVVSKRTGRPGKGIGKVTLKKVDTIREKVYAFPWYSIKSPSPKDFETAWEQA